MSVTAALNMHHHAPPQTYSRLFRPWDTQRREEKISIKSEHSASSSRRQQQHQHQQAMDATRITIKSERSRSSSSSSSSRSSTSSLSSGRSSADVGAIDDSAIDGADGVSVGGGGAAVVGATPFSYEDTLAVSQAAAAAAAVAPCFQMAAMHHLCDASPLLPPHGAAIEHLSPHHQPHMSVSTPPPTPSAAAATIGTPSGPAAPSMPPTMNDLYFAASANVAAAAAAASFGMDPYTLGCMEQEYARIIAEEAHLKALNARKQRPKKFKCPHCDVAFSNNGQLKGHIRIHTGERPFKCDVESCGKTFTRNEELTRHKRIHTGLRPYPCSACGKKFGRRDHLKKHMKTHLPQERQMGAALFMPMYPYLYGC